MSPDYKSDCEANLYKVYVTLFRCASSRGIILDIVLWLDANPFIRSLKRFISRHGCPAYINSGGKKSRNLSVDFQFGISPWQGGFFEKKD